MKLDEVTKEFVATHGRYCSIDTIKWWQYLFYSFVIIVLVSLLFYRWDVSLCMVTFILAFWYLSVAFFRIATVMFSVFGFGTKRVKPEEIDSINEKDLPVYTILIPLYKEANIADKIIASIENIDYPKDKLDIKLLLEQDDTKTISVVQNCDLPDYYDVIIVPDFLPKTKPRACNFGLKRAKGDICVIFDAEDKPEKDQLKKVYYLFNKLPQEYACIQARLNYFNPMQNLLTRWFTVEYSTTFDLYLPGLELLSIPVPLGGTSNHFRTDILKKVGGWDPFNVTEDCDLGIRIYVKGYRTCLVESTTWEEANSNIWNWIRQRSRWVKGFFQTHLTHTRNPFRTLKELGPWGMFGFYMCVGGSSFMMVINVVYWIIGLIYGFLLWHGMANGETFKSIVWGPQSPTYEGIEILGRTFKAWPMIFTGAAQDVFWSTISIVFFTVGCVLILANFGFVFIHILACFKRKYYSLLPAALLMPVYWILISIGAWKGFIQLFTNPFYWEKTIHGLDHEENDIPVTGATIAEDKARKVDIN